ncbi:hypothetical protein Cgig2_025267 [Carnegiea gigantea]|uniref:Kinesin-like protein n=1 Tax=Carnegiea gigantea TaxID=171969 RepID=A0A9Q1QF48_9CARY|nr:hypothetical protein Cgig2_025267 [Carnegiea gigantea]
MENGDGMNNSLHDKECVKVAVNVRPLVTSELLQGCTDCITIVPGEHQVQIGSHAFSFDYVFGNGAIPCSKIFDECVAPLVEALFKGYNGTVLAYGQFECLDFDAFWDCFVFGFTKTGSGKTYTMGTNYNGEEKDGGIIPKVMEMIFSRVESMKGSTEFLIRVSFIEVNKVVALAMNILDCLYFGQPWIVSKASFLGNYQIFKEEVFDLLDLNPLTVPKGEGPPPVTKPAGPGRVPIQIRETVNGGITLAGVTEPEVRSKEEMASYLSRGSFARATGSTNMNSQSSRSHAIFTISMEQKRISGCPTGSADDPGDEILSAKLHLVDLAGSERAKRTGADGMRLKEGIHINKGLLALGNVISALGDEKKRKEGGHVPYRDSKLTRLLQDSLGGNSKTVMIGTFYFIVFAVNFVVGDKILHTLRMCFSPVIYVACVSPADTNAEETLNTLKYANRARNIQNKAVINRDPVAAQMQRMRSQIEQLQAELLYYRGDSSVPFEELQILKHKISLLEASNAELQRELQERCISCEHLSQRALEAQVEKDKLILKLEAARGGKSWDEIESDRNQGVDLVKTYVSKIQELEGELVRLQSLNSLKRDGFPDSFDTDEEILLSKNACYVNLNELSSLSDPNELPDDESDEKEREHSSLQERLDRELKELDKKLEQKEAEMKRFAVGDTSVLKQHYEKKVMELEHEKKALQKEIEELSRQLANISSNADEGTQKLKEEYLQKLNALEAKVSELKKKQEAQAQLLKQKQKSDEAAKRLQEEIQRIKSQKVQLQNKIKQESEQFRMWKASREKEVLQLKKEGRRNEYEMHKLLALNQRQKLVLQRKTEEAAMATKRLKDLLEAKKAASRDVSGKLNASKNSILCFVALMEYSEWLAIRSYFGHQLGVDMLFYDGKALMHGIEHELEVTVRVHEVRSQYERQMEE